MASQAKKNSKKGAKQNMKGRDINEVQDENCELIYFKSKNEHRKVLIVNIEMRGVAASQCLSFPNIFNFIW